LFRCTVPAINVDYQADLDGRSDDEHYLDANHGAEKIFVVGLSDTSIEPHAMVIEFVHALVAKLAVHGFFSDLNVAYPALFRWILWIQGLRPLVRGAVATLDPPFVVFVFVVVASATVRAQEQRIGRIDFHCHESVASGGSRQSTKEYRDRDRNRQGEKGGNDQEEFYHQGGQEDPHGDLWKCVRAGEPVRSRGSYRGIGHGAMLSRPCLFGDEARRDRWWCCVRCFSVCVFISRGTKCSVPGMCHCLARKQAIAMCAGESMLEP